MFSYRNYTVKRYWRESLLLALLLANVLVWGLVSQKKSSDILSVYFLDVGQGDAIFFETPDKKQVLIDGGKNRKVLTELGKIMSFDDRYIDVVIETHPDLDHAGGLVAVRESYEVGLNLDQNTARRGQVINFGDGVMLAILFPTGDVSKLDPNDGSVVAKLVYGGHSFLLTADAGLRTENILLNLAKTQVDTDVLKAGHHGSRTSTSLPFAQAASPMYAIISSGKGNSYGHPHKEVLSNLEKVSAEVLNTAEKGTIKFETDGKILELK